MIPSSTGSATILVVDDEASVRLVTRRLLLRWGYTVLEADSGEQAIQVAAQCNGPIDLVVTDVVMPGMSGQMVASAMLRLRPGIRVLFMSGYTAEQIAERGGLGDGAALLQKPFDPAALAGKIRELLDATDGRGEP